MTSIYDSSCCSSDSPCSSSSLAIPTLLLFDNQNSPIPSPISIPDPTTNRQNSGVSFDKREGEWRRRRSADGTEGLQNGSSLRSDNEKQQIKGSSPLNGKVREIFILNGRFWKFDEINLFVKFFKIKIFF